MKKFIALALALAMMVSCLVFTASAESSVVVELQGPESIATGATFEVKVRVTDASNIVGGVQGTVDVEGATLVKVESNPELNVWNSTEDTTTLYKQDGDDITFAALNSLEANTHDTRLWFILTYTATADEVSVNLANVKVSNKDAQLIAAENKNLAISVINPVADPYMSVTSASLIAKAEANVVENQGMVVKADFANLSDDVTEFGVIFYPTALLAGKELTLETQGAVVAKTLKAEQPAMYEAVMNDGKFQALLKYAFNTEEDALRFLGTKVSARAYYKIGDKVVYTSNANGSYINGGVANRAALNVVLDNAGKITDPVDGITKEQYEEAAKGLTTNVEGWQANRKTALKYLVDNAVAGKIAQ